jgi:enoyl-CoA hydratase/carnithine racemase
MVGSDTVRPTPAQPGGGRNQGDRGSVPAQVRRKEPETSSLVSRWYTLAMSNLDVREEHGGRLARLVLRSPPENALDIPLLESLRGAVDGLERLPSLCCVVIEGDGRDFSTGLASGHRRPPWGELLLSQWHATARRLASLDVVLVARVHGRCFGAGAELALLCDAVLTNGAAKFSFPDLSIGTFSPLASVLLPWKIGPSRATELLLSARTLEADEARSLGLSTATAGGWDDLDSLVAQFLSKHVLSRDTAAVRTQARALHQPLVPLLGAHLDELEQLAATRLESLAEDVVEVAVRPRRPR